MSSSMFQIRKAACLAIAGLLLSTPAAPQPVRKYKTGLDFEKEGQWEQVEKMMREAIAERPDEKRRRGFGGSYFPHYYLGLARYHQGDCAGALAAWEESESQGAIVGKKEYNDLVRLQADCEKRGVPSMAGSSSAAPGSAGNRQGAKTKARKGQRLVERGADPARKTLGVIGKLAPDSDLGKAARQGQGVVDVLESATDLVDLALPPERRLQAAIDAYFAGGPASTLEWLEDIDLKDPRARAQVYLFRAAANFRLHCLAGYDEARLAAARENADLFQQEPWRDDFPEELFDPRFVRFLRGG